MRIAPPIRLNSEQQEALEQCARARSLSVRLVERAGIVFLRRLENGIRTWRLIRKSSLRRQRAGGGYVLSCEKDESRRVSFPANPLQGTRPKNVGRAGAVRPAIWSPLNRPPTPSGVFKDAHLSNWIRATNTVLHWAASPTCGAAFELHGNSVCTTQESQYPWRQLCCSELSG